ncbi:hypothetical protein SAMN05661093_08747 [Kibdelosporangium aridum]|uniref:Uncharacterized protein n=1 Tax=Kibdelosporangium aridum TaxID=2030 RepID=A0A1W2FSN7_KIBAR|nr:hypothetical protein SAMN05661093_08747 [Kibdelosporangium aridum]
MQGVNIQMPERGQNSGAVDSPAASGCDFTDGHHELKDSLRIS